MSPPRGQEAAFCGDRPRGGMTLCFRLSDSNYDPEHESLRRRRWVRDAPRRRILVFPPLIEQGPHPIPSRTRKLSPVSAMVLPGSPGGRVARRWVSSASGVIRTFLCPAGAIRRSGPPAAAPPARCPELRSSPGEGPPNPPGELIDRQANGSRSPYRGPSPRLGG